MNATRSRLIKRQLRRAARVKRVLLSRVVVSLVATVAAGRLLSRIGGAARRRARRALAAYDDRSARVSRFVEEAPLRTRVPLRAFVGAGVLLSVRAARWLSRRL